MAGSRVAIITGSAGALGSVVTTAFSNSGYRVAAFARSWKEPPPGVLPIEADLADPAACGAAVRQVVDHFQRVDALVHLAGGFEGGSRVEVTPLDVWHKMFSINFWSGIHMMQAVLPVMRNQGGGRAVMVGSRAAAEPVAGLSAYAASKAALLQVVRVAAAENRDAGITVNALLPSTIDTEANRREMGPENASRWVSPASLAQWMLWLCSEEARDVTGALIPIYGRV